MRQHKTLKNTEILPVPPGAINLRSADGSPLKLKGYARFELTLGEITLPVEALVLPSLGPDKMLLDNSIMGAFGAVLDWQAEQLTFKTSRVKITAQHRKTRLPTPTETDSMTCSVVALERDTQAIPVYLTKKCTIPANHEMALEVHANDAPDRTITALVEPRIVTEDDMEASNAPQAFRRAIVARTVCNWSPRGAMVQIANPSNRLVRIKRNTLLGYIRPVKAVMPQTTSSVNTTTAEETAKHREELKKALSKAFQSTTFSPEQCEEILTTVHKVQISILLEP